jgi:hypothetical protein
MPRATLSILFLCLCAGACGGGGSQSAATDASFELTPIKVDLLPFDVAGTQRAQPAATMGALEAL